MWPAFKRYFVTVQLSIGIAMAIRLFLDERLWLHAFIGFFGVVPFSAVLAFGRAWYVQRHPEAELPDPPIRWARTLTIALIASVVFIGSLIVLDQFYW